MKTEKGILIVLLSALSIGAYAQLDSSGRYRPSDTARLRTTMPNRPIVPSPGIQPAPYPSTTPPVQPPATVPPPNAPGTPQTPIPPTTPPPPQGLLTASISTRQDTLHKKKHVTQPLDSLRTQDLPRYTPKKDTIR